MEAELKHKWKQLKEILDLVAIPIEKESSFSIKAMNAGVIQNFHVLDNTILNIDLLKFASNVETIWTFQDRRVTFFMAEGELEVFFRSPDDKTYSKYLHAEQVVSIPNGLPFMLKSYVDNCIVLLVSLNIKDQINEYRNN